MNDLKNRESDHARISDVYQEQIAYLKGTVSKISDERNHLECTLGDQIKRHEGSNRVLTSNLEDSKEIVPVLDFKLEMRPTKKLPCKKTKQIKLEAKLACY